MVNTRKMESRIEGCDSRLNMAERQIEQLGSDVNTMKNDFSTLKILLTDFINDFKGKSKMKNSKQAGKTSYNQDKGETEHEKEKDDHEGDNVDFSSFRKLDMPLFCGEDPLGWIFRVERYFKVNRVAEKEKLDAALLCFEQRALNWVQSREV